MRYRDLNGLALAASLTFAAIAGPALAQTSNPYDGLKKTVSVDKFQAAEAVGGTVTAEGMTAMLTDALSRDGRFVVVEPVGGADTVAPLAASAVVRAAVTKYEPAAGGSSLGIGGLPMGSLFAARAGVRSQKSVMEISLRLVDSATGQVISTSKAQGFAKSSGVDATLVDSRTGASATGGRFKASPIGQAGEDAIAKAVELIAASMRDVPWSALVIEASSGKIYVNAGADRNVQSGTALHVYRKGKVLTDPSTGVVLDVEMEPIGVIQVDSVRDKISTAVVTSGGPPARGDVLRLN
ncbi:CsgG/HfaB family protein [Phenylobacterium sp.]|uniref:CsgG/HfaB family protein n=1 Tax=Phenylobacterium sp. TaxID=1871053 RepID=UPI002717EBF5|nr:CsgG/HfaB family protein [Phenylobacterium sp.]MDO8381172.1 CsgG/HfaB family protein [Phenylobacterium sp.]